MHTKIDGLEVGYDIPALPGMDEADIQTPCLCSTSMRWSATSRRWASMPRKMGVRHRVHGKMHKSVDVAKLQDGAGRRLSASAARRSPRPRSSPAAASRTCWSPTRSATRPRSTAWRACPSSAPARSAALTTSPTSPTCRRRRQKHGTTIECLVEIDCGAGRCGVTTTPDVVAIAKAIDAAPGLKFSGIQAYQGAMQHMDNYEDRKAKIDIAVAMVKDAVDTLKAEGLDCDIVGGGGTGSYYFEGNSGVYNELQCGSYAFMDADYGRILDKDGNRIDQGEWENALFILTS
jgi:3-hydroxy-D-aspartate aldolase